MGRIILVRHGETDKNIGNKLHSIDDPETLNAVGREQIAKLARRLKTHHPQKLLSSKESRAIQSAEIIAKVLKIPLKTIDGLQERDWGIFSGKPWAEIQAILGRMSLDERYRYVPTGGESWKEFESRLVETIRKITWKDDGETIVIVTHGGAIRALLPFLLNVPRQESFKYDPQNASLTIFDFDDTEFHQVLIDDISHLEK